MSRSSGQTSDRIDLEAGSHCDADAPANNHVLLPPCDLRIRRPPNAWILYRSEKLHRHRTAALTGHKKPRQADLSRIIADQWHNETPDVKERYEQMAIARKAEHKAQNPDYRFHPRRRAPAKSEKRRVHPRRRRKQAMTTSSEDEEGDRDVLAWQEKPELVATRRSPRTRRGVDRHSYDVAPAVSMDDTINWPGTEHWARRMASNVDAASKNALPRASAPSSSATERSQSTCSDRHVQHKVDEQMSTFGCHSPATDPDDASDYFAPSRQPSTSESTPVTCLDVCAGITCDLPQKDVDDVSLSWHSTGAKQVAGRQTLLTDKRSLPFSVLASKESPCVFSYHVSDPTLSQGTPAKLQDLWRVNFRGEGDEGDVIF